MLFSGGSTFMLKGLQDHPDLLKNVYIYIYIYTHTYICKKKKKN